ncbi:O-antigen ligase family protein [Marivita sp. XM-24bin2]|jgi:hypothetical protein|uniref:O-antigen ligase family protein n=1 Tax=unclassified Marivita TaxID=2632480 RepID=UPI000D7A18A5|nr:O-antigen ligase family protein [Marivita sp. XM-24bin2]MCR9111526.1 O-antigen ligase family protein [Paracoccaceae bacterium]PWL33406.1 MAG: hypothetical protein DCO97_19870 [Marivita sp. XM-24bin2]
MNFDVRDFRSAALFLVFLASTLSLSLGWLYLAPSGAGAQRVPYVLFPILGLVLLLFPDRLLTAIWQLARRNAIWLSLYCSYLVLLSFRLAGLPDDGMIFRQFFFITCAITFGAGIIAVGASPKTLRYGGILSIAGFLVISEFVAQQIGLSWSHAMQAFVSSGDLNFVTYEFLRELFRFSGPETLLVPASEKNLVAVALFTVLILFRAGHVKSGPDVLGWVLTGLTIVVLVLLNTRSVLVVAAISLISAVLLSFVRPRPSTLQLLGLILMCVLVSGVLVILFSSDLTALASLQGRFAFDDASTGARTQQIGFAISKINERIIFGWGLTEINGQLVHNLFLGAWMHAGLLAFVLVTTAYIAMLGSWLGFIVGYIFRPNLWVLPLRAEWVAMLPTLFFFRVWIAGDAGHPGLGEWIGFFSFQGILVVNLLAAQAGLTRSSEIVLKMARHE